MRAAQWSRGAVIEGPTVGGPDDANVVPFDRSSRTDGSRGRHPAGGARRDDVDAAPGGDEVHDDRDAPDGLPSERSIAHGLVQGRRWALAAAFERWADLVNGVARQYVGHGHADDVTQQVFVEAWRSRRTFSADLGEVPGWLVGITRNVARTHLRGQAPPTLEVADTLDADPTAPNADVLVDSMLVASAFRDLPSTQRAVLELTLVEEFTQREAALELDIPLGTVKTRHRRGLERLRAALGVVSS